MRSTAASSFFSPSARAPASAGPTPSHVKRRTDTPLTDRRMAATPFSRSAQSVITLFSPMTKNSFTYEAYQEFLVQSYFTSEKSRTRAKKQGDGEADGHKLQFEEDIEGYLDAKSPDELARIKQIYEEHEDEVERIRYWLLQLVELNSSEMIKLVLDGLSLTQFGVVQCADGLLDVLAEELISQIGNQLHTFDAGLRQQVFQRVGTSYDEKNATTPLRDQEKERQCRSSAERILIQATRRILLDNNLVKIQSSSCYRSPAVWFFILAFLGLAVGASLHFMPVIGAAIALTMAVEWLALLINIALPAVALGMVLALVPVIFTCCQKKAPPPPGSRIGFIDPVVDGSDFGQSPGGIRAKTLVFSSTTTSAATSPRVPAPDAVLAVGVAVLNVQPEPLASVGEESAPRRAMSPSSIS